MASDIQLKRSSVSGRIPDAANVLVGEPVVNLADKVIYTKDGGGNVVVIGAGTTSNIAEGTNQYFTNARARSALTDATIQGNIAVTGNITASAISANTFVCGTGTGGSITGANLLSATYIQGNNWSGLYTANVVETSTELYFTNARVYSNVISIGYATNTNVALKANVVDLTTANVTEVTNLYFTNARSRQAISVTGAGSYDNTTGIITITGSSGGGNVTVSATPPESPSVGDIWFDSDDGVEYLYFDDGSSSQWVDHENGVFVQYEPLKANISDLTTANVIEVSELYFTNARSYSNAITAGFATQTYVNQQIASIPVTESGFSPFLLAGM